MSRHLGIESQEAFSECQGVGVGQAEACVVAERTDVGHMVVEAFKLEQDGT
jgi:hypothetical protein